MNKSIKVTEAVYTTLLEFQRPRETFSQVIARLLVAAQVLVKLEPLLVTRPPRTNNKDTKDKEDDMSQ